MSIKPTVARMVWFIPMPGDPLFGQTTNGQPLAGQIAHVRDDGKVNLGVLDRDGQHHARQGVAILEDGGDARGESYCVWMPFQIGQAKALRETAVLVSGQNSATFAGGSIGTGNSESAKAG